ncbi:M23 family metallopeptidase [Martelella sp. HB161492]|uniref:M23 family metallopeptidase n=1 Tax=Martelella sp. HB161492 TaxID=2720726 RepID=UPI0015902592|nr:M23 family metallopeptidase [Martelella sp. HB161492]
MRRLRADRHLRIVVATVLFAGLSVIMVGGMLGAIHTRFRSGGKAVSRGVDTAELAAMRGNRLPPPPDGATWPGAVNIALQSSDGRTALYDYRLVEIDLDPSGSGTPFRRSLPLLLPGDGAQKGSGEFLANLFLRHAKAPNVLSDRPVNAIRAYPSPPAAAVREIDSFPQQPASLMSYLRKAGVTPGDLLNLSSALENWQLLPGDTLELFVDPANGDLLLARRSHDGAPIWSMVRTDDGEFVASADPGLLAMFRRSARLSAPPDGVSSVVMAEPESGSLKDGIGKSVADTGLPDNVASAFFELASENGIAFDGKGKAGDRIDLLYRSLAGNDGAAELVYAAATLDGATHRFFHFRHAAERTDDYFDEGGQSATVFLTKKPVPAGRKGDGFGWRMHPVLHVRKFHEGNDFPAPMGSPILAGGDGTVERISREVGYGKYVRIRHDQGYETTYAHLSEAAPSLKVGDRVHQGDVIAYVGSTGYSTGPHLYYELKVDGHYVDPSKQHLHAGTILHDDARLAFDKTVSRDAEILDRFRRPDLCDDVLTAADVSRAVPACAPPDLPSSPIAAIASSALAFDSNDDGARQN